MHRLKNNNRGAALITVLICMLFVSIIAAAILYITSRNSQSVGSSLSSSKNFYSAETAMDTVKTKMQEHADTAAKKAYQEWLQNYSKYSGESGDAFNMLVAVELFRILAGDSTITKDDLIAGTIKPINLPTLLGVTPGTPLGFTLLNSELTDPNCPCIVYDATDKVVKIKNIAIEYVDNGFSTYLTTDFAFGTDKSEFKLISASGTNLECASYAIIADETVTNGLSSSGEKLASGSGTTKIVGNVYGGGYNKVTEKYDGLGFCFSNDFRNYISAKYLITRSTFDVDSRAFVKLQGLNTGVGGVTDYCELWANNIDMSGKSTALKNVELNITGNCYLADDLSLDAEYSKFKMTSKQSGSPDVSKDEDDFGLFAFNQGSLTGEASGSSAIVINGKNSVLDLRGAKNIWIAGKSYVAVPKFFGSKELDGTFQQGESLSYRALQSAYLLPGECIPGVNHNPMTEAEFNAAESSIDLDLCESLPLKQYADTYSKAMVQYTSGGANMIYLYLHFKNASKAAEYFTAYNELYSDLLISKMKEFGADGKIYVDYANSKVVSTGNVITYDSDKTPALTIHKNTTDTADGTVISRQTTYRAKYKSLCNYLTKTGASTTVQRITDTLVDFDKVKADIKLITDNPTVAVGGELDRDEAGFRIKTKGGTALEPYVIQRIGTMVEDDSNPGTKKFEPEKLDVSYLDPENGTNTTAKTGAECVLITGQDITINENMAGIILATGDVRINASFRGMIIAQGTVVINGVAAHAKDAVTDWIQFNDIIKPYFGYDVVEQKKEITEVSTSDIISIGYENWKKD